MSTAKLLALAGRLRRSDCVPSGMGTAEARQPPLAVPGAEPQRTVTLRGALDAAWQRAVVARESDGSASAPRPARLRPPVTGPHRHLSSSPCGTIAG